MQRTSERISRRCDPMHRLAAALAVAVLGTSAFAQNKDKAREAYLRATQQYELGEYAQALDGFKDAYRNFEDPAFLFDLAQCHRQLGDSRQAIHEYRMYLLKLPDAPNQRMVLDIIAKLERSAIPRRVAPPEEPSASEPIATPPALTAPTPSVVVAPQVQMEARSPTPLYKRWWLWTAVGAAAVVAIGVGVGVSRSPATPTANTALGTFRF